jgi:iron-sulfur cluster repair protein YtfE (RIC family)
MSEKPTPLERTLAQHFALRQQIRALEQLLKEHDDPRGANLTKTHTLLEAFDPVLREHFAEEERGGYFSEALSAAPRLNRRAERLAANHIELRERLEKLLDLTRTAADAPDKWQKVTTGLAEFVKTLRAHEDEENDLVREAFMDDLGRGD